MGFDSDDPIASGEVGKVGVAIDSIDDMKTLFGGLPLDRVSTSMTINAPAGVLTLLYQLAAEEEDISGGERRVTVQNEVLKEDVARGSYIFAPKLNERLTTEIFRYCRAE